MSNPAERVRTHPTFREARRDDVPAIVALLRDDAYGADRETADDDAYLAAFDALAAEPGNTIVVAEMAGAIVATYQIAVLSGLSLRATRRAQVESVRVASHLRGRGIGRAMMDDAQARARARAAGCNMLQLTTHAGRNRARDFYERLGFVPSHVGFKRPL